MEEERKECNKIERKKMRDKKEIKGKLNENRVNMQNEDAISSRLLLINRSIKR